MLQSVALHASSGLVWAEAQRLTELNAVAFKTIRVASKNPVFLPPVSARCESSLGHNVQIIWIPEQGVRNQVLDAPVDTGNSNTPPGPSM